MGAHSVLEDEEHGHWEKDYPEAPGEVQKYATTISNLNQILAAVQSSRSSVNSIKFQKGSVKCPPNEGDYYNVYIRKSEDWFDIVDDAVSVVDTFITDLGTCIANAQTKKTEWEAKAKLEHWVVD